VRKHYLEHKSQARKTIIERAHFFANLYGVKLNRISIKNIRTRWGSCSKLGNLNFTYKLIFLPRELMDYVIIHEVCHLLEFNHSYKFWDQVARTMPQYKNIVKQMRKINLLTLGHEKLDIIK
jgi:predicted metal-dependent hydrolase